MFKKIYIVDDEPAIRDSIRILLRQDGYDVEAFESADDFLKHCDVSTPACVIADVRMPGKDGLQLQEDMKRLHIFMPIVFLTGHGDIPMSVTAIQGGAADFLTKPVTRSRLSSSLNSAFKRYVRLHEQALRKEEANNLLRNLTDREREVMLLAITGLPNKEIARRLNISHRTVEIHRGKIFLKTHTSNILELVRIAQNARIGPYEIVQ